MRRLTGSITVFLSLVFLLVFALFGTLLETARYTVCKNHAARTLRTGAEGLLSEYNRPLYEHYGLFFIEKGGTPYEQVIGRYAGDTISAADKGEMDFRSCRRSKRAGRARRVTVWNGRDMADLETDKRKSPCDRLLKRIQNDAF